MVIFIYMDEDTEKDLHSPGKVSRLIQLWARQGKFHYRRKGADKVDNPMVGRKLKGISC